MTRFDETHVQLQCDALSDVRIGRLAGREAMNELTRLVVEIEAEPVADLDQLLFAPVGVSIDDALEGSTRRLLLIVTEAAVLESPPDDRARLELVLEPAVAALRECSGYRVFVEKTTIEIVTKVLQESSFDDQLDLRLSEKYAVRPQCVQYDETDWTFIERLLADEGISYWFDLDGDEPKLVLCDSIDGCAPIVAPTAVPYADDSEMNTMRHFSSLEVSDEVCIGSTMVRAVDPSNPKVPVDGKAGAGFGHWFEYPARVNDAAGAKRRADVRLLQLQRLARVSEARSDVVRLAPGRRLALIGCADEDMNVEQIVVAVEHALGGESGRYANTTSMVPSRSFHPPGLPRWPSVPSIEPAVTTGPSGAEIHVHTLGEVKLRFPWDRSGILDDKSSYWMRIAQMNLGGSMLLPRVGWEVPVMYLHGDPDQPIVLGRFFNGQTKLALSLPGAKASTNFGTSTHPGGGSANVICMGDTAGSQSFAINASHDQTENVGGARTTTISANLTHSVGLSSIVGVHGSQSVTVSGSQTVDVGNESMTGISGSRSVVVGAAEIVKVGGNRSVVTGPYSETIGAVQGTLCNQHNSEVLGGYVQSVGASAALQCALGSGETVLGGRMHDVGGALSFTVVNYNGGSIGPCTITSGEAAITCGAGPVATNGAVVTATVGTLHVDAAADVVFDVGGAMTVDVSGNITTPAGTIGGGQIKITSGGEKFEGEVKRTGATVISS